MRGVEIALVRTYDHMVSIVYCMATLRYTFESFFCVDFVSCRQIHLKSNS